MKANRYVFTLLLLVNVGVFQLLAQQSETDRKLLAEIRAKANNGDSRSQYELGATYAVGDLGTEKDEAEAAKWFRKAADQSFADAQATLGWCYQSGTGVTKDYVEAVKWYRKASEQNHAKAQVNLGVCYANGFGVVEDDSEAVKWFHKAAEQGQADAQFKLGVFYANARGCAKRCGGKEKYNHTRKFDDTGTDCGRSKASAKFQATTADRCTRRV